MPPKNAIDSPRYDALVAAIKNGDETVLSRLQDFSEGKVRWRQLVPELGLDHYGQLLDLMGIACLPLYQVDAQTQCKMIQAVVDVLRRGAGLAEQPHSPCSSDSSHLAIEEAKQKDLRVR